jgi:4'-phosphopantetheinyl transferase
MMAPAATIEVHCADVDRADPTDGIDLAEPIDLARAARFRRPIDARRFLARRATTRRLLAARLGAAPHEIGIAQGAFGKPFVLGASLQFSTSHAGPLLLVALADTLAVGCDIERVRPARDLLTIAATCFTVEEASRIATLSGIERDAAFYDCWTRKEAYLKAIGTGLSLPMNSFEFAAGGDDGVERLDLVGADWSSVGWNPAPGYRAAIVAPGACWRLDRR